MITKWYIPGMISLIGILPLFIWKTQPLKQQFDQRVMTVFLPKDGEFDGTLSMMYSEQVILSELAGKRQTAFYLNDFIEKRGDMLERIRHAAQEIKFGYDTSRIVKVVFGENCNFGDLVSVMNICLMDEHKRWAWVKDSIFIFSPPAPSLELPLDFMVCGTSYINLESPAREWCKEEVAVLKESGLLFSGYVALLVFSSRVLIGRIKYRLK